MPRTASPRPAAPGAIDAYLAGLPDDGRRAALGRLREAIRAAVPEAAECISYGMPAFRVPGGVIAGFQATSKGCSYYPFSGTTLDALGPALRGYGRTRSALHLDPARPLPLALLRRLLRARLAELPARAARPRRAPATASSTRRPRSPASRPRR